MKKYFGGGGGGGGGQVGGGVSFFVKIQFRLDVNEELKFL